MGSCGAACLLLLLLGVHVSGESMSDLLDGDMVGPVLQMLTGSSGRRYLTVCDLAVSLLQAVEASKAERMHEVKRKQQKSLDRYRRAHDEGINEATPNPILASIVRSYLRALREDRLAQRRRVKVESALARAKQDLEEQFRDPSALEEEDASEEILLLPPADEEEGEDVENNIKESSSSVIQRIFHDG